MTANVYESFSGCRDFSFRDQIQRASVSVMNNIAEGYARKSDKAFANFLYIARGSSAEVESMLLLSESLGYISSDKKDTLLSQNDEVSKLLSAFIRSLRTMD